MGLRPEATDFQRIDGLDDGLFRHMTKEYRTGATPTSSRQVLSILESDIMAELRQLLLRVPDEMHQRLAARARREGRSVNAIANEILDSSADVDLGSSRDRVRARAVALGILARPQGGPGVVVTSRQEVLRLLSGTKVTADELLDFERGRMDG